MHFATQQTSKTTENVSPTKLLLRSSLLAFLILLCICTTYALNTAVTMAATYTKTNTRPKLSGNEYFASPTGSNDGSGTIEDPWDLQTAFNKSTVIQPGDILWLRDGVYGTGGSTLFYTKLNGTATQPIIIRQYPGERATINGGIVAQSSTNPTYTSSYNWFWGFEITNTSLNRMVTPEERSTGLNLLTQGHKAINLVINNTGHPGIGFWRPVTEGEIYGSIFWGTGIYDTAYPGYSGNRGSAIYAQNEVGTRFIEDNISFRTFTTGMKAYTVNSFINGFNFIGNTIFDTPEWLLFVSSDHNPARDLVIKNNMLYRNKHDPNQTLQAGATDMINARIEDNYIVGGKSDLYSLSAKKWENLSVINNTIIGSKALSEYLPNQNISSILWNNNSYFGGTYSPKQFNFDGTFYNFENWKNMSNFDASSTYTAEFPTGQQIFVRKNKYEPKRANITIYNHGMAPTAIVDLSAILVRGDKYEIRDAQNFFGKPIMKGKYNGYRSFEPEIELPLYLTDVSPIVGDTPTINNVHTLAEFNSFVLVPVEAQTTFVPQTQAVIIDPPGALFGDKVTVSMKSKTRDAVIRYTLDGTEPGANSTVYVNPITVASNTTIKAMAFYQGYDSSIRTQAKFAKYDIDNGLQGHWSFKEGSGTIVADGTSTIGDGQIIGNPQWVNGRYDSALKLDGVDDYVMIGPTTQPNAFTISFWAKGEYDDDYGVVVGNAGGWPQTNYLTHLNVRENATNYFALSTYSTTQQTSTGNTAYDCKDMTLWNHYAAAYDGSNMKTYCNGRLINTVPLTGTVGSGGTLVFGRWGSGDHHYFKGTIDEVRIYNRALENYDIVKLADEPMVSNENILVR